jgi:hypothetical protein
METINTYLTLLRKGVSIETLGRFFTQPILREFVAELPKTKSFILPSNPKRHDIAKRVAAPYETASGKAIHKGPISVEQLTKWLGTQSTQEESIEFNAGQLAVLQLYNQYRKEALEVSEFTSMIAYDSKAPMNRLHAKLKKKSLDRFLQADQNTDSLGIKGTTEFIEDSWMSTMVKASNNVLPLLKDFYLTDDNAVINRLVDDMGSRIKYNSEQDIMKAIGTAENDFVTFLISSGVINKEGGQTLSDEVSRLVQGPNSVARRWRKFQKENPTNILAKELFSQLQIHTDPKNLGYSFDNVRAFARSMPSTEVNLLSEAFTELYDGSIENQNLAKDLVKLAIIQSGMNKSPVSFMRIVPPRLYSKLATEAIERYKMGAIDENRFYEQFYKNNWNNELLVPTVRPKNISPQDQERGVSPYPAINNNELEIKTTSWHASRPYLKVWGPDPSISELKKQRLQKAGKRLPVIAKLFKRPMFNPESKTILYKQVGKLGDGINLKEYSNNPHAKSIIPLNNYILTPDMSIKASELAESKEVDSQVLEGNIFTFAGIPVVPINLEGVHSEGLALQAKRRGLLKESIDNNFKPTTKIIVMPTKLELEGLNDLNLTRNGLAKVSKIAQTYPDKKILVPLLDGDVNVIVPLLKTLIESSPNISIVVASSEVSNTDAGIAHIKVIKKLLNC